MKKLFKNENGDIHFGVLAPAGFVDSTAADVRAALTAQGSRRLWRCLVCNDLHLGMEPPAICPTCTQKDVYMEISETEFSGMIGL